MFLNCRGKIPDSDFRAVIISDIHVSNDQSKIDRLNILLDAINNNRIPDVKLLVVTGDVVSCVYGNYWRDNPDTSDNRIRRALHNLSFSKVPVHLVLGNHDYKIGRDRDSDTYFPEIEILEMERIWHAEAGIRPYYSKEYEGWNFIFLNSMRGRYLHRNFDDHQLHWLETELIKNKPSIIFFHHPLKTDHFRLWSGPEDMINPEKEPEFYRILSKYKKYIKGIFVGHGHAWVKDTLFDRIEVFETASFGDSDKVPFFEVGIKNIDSTIYVLRHANFN
jgi:metallophosphoesterase superfamily enzyme